MGFLAWHYSSGLQFYINNWLAYFDWINHYFSLTLLISSLFAPWKRLVVEDKSPGFNITKFIESITFNIISRLIGAIVRFALFWVGLILLILAFFAGISGLLIWIILPVVGLPVYRRITKHPKRFVEKLMFRIMTSGDPIIKTIFDNDAGKFVLAHTGLKLEELTSSAKISDSTLEGVTFESYEQIISHLIKGKVWKKEFFRKKGVTGQDLILTASWWDKKHVQIAEVGEVLFGRPGLGLELLFGYTPNLNQYSTDLSTPQSYSHRLIGREQVVGRMERALTGETGVILVGQPGVGKKTVVLEFAHRASQGKLGPKMAYRRVLEFDYNFVLSEAADLNLKKAKLSQILSEAAAAGNIIMVIRDLHRLTNKEVEGYDFTDIFEDHLERGGLKIIGISIPREYERFIVPNTRLRKYFEDVEVTQPTKKEAMLILIEHAKRWETLRDLTITIPSLRKILEESDRYITEIPFPEKALELLDAVVIYREQKGGKTVTVDDANKVLAEKTGVSFARLTKAEKKTLGNLEEIIHRRLIDQESAVGLIAKSLRAKTVGVTKENRPLGSFLFLGPTGVGKTETAKVLARVYYGGEENILRFDMAEFAGREGLERLIGSVDKNQPGALTSAIKNRPASLLLLDEFEKASKAIYNLFLTLLDEGEMTDAFGKKIIGRHLFVIGTSNAGAEYIRQLVGKGVRGEDLQNKVVNHVLEKGIFTPEFLNRFDGVVVYEPLREEDLVKIARLQLEDLAANLKSKNMYLQVTDDAARKLAVDGYDPAFGARPMKRIINLILGDLLGRAILSGELKEGNKIKIVPGKGKEEYDWTRVR
ncbi:MAG: AAA family ATPase [Patescibacteria group bacterium]